MTCITITKVVDGKVMSETVPVDKLTTLFKETIKKRRLVLYISGDSIQYSFTS